MTLPAICTLASRTWIPAAALASLASVSSARTPFVPASSILDLAAVPSVGSEVATTHLSEPTLPQGAASAPAQSSGWKFSFAPYLWMMGIEGDGTVNGTDFEFEKDFSDLVDHVDVAASFLFRAQYDRWVGTVMYDYADISIDDLDVPAGGSFESKLNLVEAAFGYQVDGWSEGQTFDLMLGVRSVHVDNELDTAGPDFEGSSNATDPLFMVRPTIPLFPSSIDGLRLNSTLAIGGGGDSDLVWELSPVLEYQFSDTISGRFGYRRVGWRFEEDNGDEVDIEFAGLILGVNFGF